MKFRGIVFLALAFALSPGAGVLADETVLTWDFNDTFTFRTFGAAGGNASEKGYSFEATQSFDSFQLVFCGGSIGTPIDDVVFDLYTADDAACEGGSGTMSCRDTLVESAVFTFTTPNADFQDSTVGGGKTCDAVEDTGVVVLSGSQSAGEYSINVRRSGTLDNTNRWLMSTETGALPVANGIDGVYTIFDGNPTIFTDRRTAAILDLFTAGGAPANEIINPPPGPFVITELPFAVNGTCDSATQSQLQIEIKDIANEFLTIDKKFVTCEIDDTWDAGIMGAAGWNASIETTLYDIVEGTFGTRELPALDAHAATIDVTGNTNEPPPIIDPGATNDDFGFLGNLIRDALIFLLIPGEEFLSRFGDLFSLISNKPPIGYLTAALEAFEGLEEGTPVETLEGTVALADYFTPLKTAFTGLLYLLFAFYLIRRVSTIRI